MAVVCACGDTDADAAAGDKTVLACSSSSTCWLWDAPAVPAWPWCRIDCDDQWLY